MCAGRGPETRALATGLLDDRTVLPRERIGVARVARRDVEARGVQVDMDVSAAFRAAARAHALERKIRDARSCRPARGAPDASPRPDRPC